MTKKIAQVVVGLPVEGPFDYAVPLALQDKISAGQRVTVSFGRQQMIGFVVGFKEKSSYQNLKPIADLLDNIPALDDKALQLTKGFSRYYGCSWGEAIETSLPSALRTKKTLELSLLKPFVLAISQKAEMVLCHDKGVHGRWPFIVDKIKQTLAQGRGVIFLVPEVSLIGKIQKILEKETVVSPAVLDKQLTAKKELEQWITVKEGKSRLVLGTRSAVFAPVNNLGLIVIYEEENPAYKQEQSPFYHVHEVVNLRSRIEKTSLLFVSSVPSVETWRQGKSSGAQIKVFEPERLADLKVVDLANYKPKHSAAMSFPLQNAMLETLSRSGKILLFLNRRGFSTMTRCNQCGFTVKCPRCNVNMPFLYEKKKMVCHLCRHEMDLPRLCPQCNSSYLRSTGGGIEKMESEVARFFPAARVAIFDRETAVVPSSADIVIATQAVLKVLEQMAISLIAILDFDAELNRSDFRCGQKAFLLLVRLRQAAKEKILVQTYQPDNYCLKAALKMDFEKFYRKELAFRRELGFPPFKHLLAIVCRGTKEEAVANHAKALYEKLAETKPAGVEVMEPQPDLVAKLRDQFRFTIMLKGKSVTAMLGAVKAGLKSVKKGRGIVTVNVDP